MSGPTRPLRDRALVHRQMVERSPNPMFLLEASSGRVLEANPAAARLLGCAQEELIGAEFHRLTVLGREEAETLSRRVTRHHHDILGELELVRCDGSFVPVELSGTLLLVEDREVVCLFARDVTERQAALAERYRLEKQLWHSQRHEAVGRLAGGIAHDFNNLLMTIMLNVDIVRDQLPENHPVRHELDEIVGGYRRARDLTRQLLAFSGKQVLKPRPVELNRVVLEMEKLVRCTIGEDIRLEVDVGLRVGMVHVDPSQLEQVVLNLVVNARDAMPEGGLLVIGTREVVLDEAFCEHHPSANPGPHVVLSMTDSGHGMDPDTLARIFEPFFTTKDQGQGTGLGLATVYGIVKQSGGNIWVESRPGGGATFEVYFPRHEGEQVAAAAPADSAGAADALRGEETILVVEDEGSIRALVAGILDQQSYSVLQADTPIAALELWAKRRAWGGPVDLVVTDVVMPGLAGPQMVEQLRREGLEAPVLFMSGYAWGQQHAAGDGFLAKPFSRLQLLREVRRMLDETA